MNKDAATRSTENWGLIGQGWAVEMFRQQIADNAICHAYLLIGPPGVGRRSLALRLAQALECLQPLQPGVPCSMCRHCRQIEAMQFPDLTVVQAEKEGGVLKVEQVRQVRQQLVLTPLQGKYRIALFLRFEEANPSASNALLKTLEEAPSHAILVLTADSVENLLPTIVSRCEVLRLRPVPVSQMQEALIKRGASAEQAQLLAHLSAGRPGLAFRYMENPTLLDFRKECLDNLHTLLHSSRVEKFAYAERLFKSRDRDKDRETFRDILLVWLTYWRDILISASGSTAPLVNIDRTDEIASLSGKLNVPEARQAVERVETALDQLDKYVNPRLLTEVLLLDLPKLRVG